MARRRVRRLSSTAEQHRRCQPGGELIDENETAARLHDPVALGQPGPLIRPVIEGGGTDHQVEGVIGVGKTLGHGHHEPESILVGGGFGDLDHGRRRVHADQGGRPRIHAPPADAGESRCRTRCRECVRETQPSPRPGPRFGWRSRGAADRDGPDRRSERAPRMRPDHGEVARRAVSHLPPRRAVAITGDRGCSNAGIAFAPMDGEWLSDGRGLTLPPAGEVRSR